MRDQHLAFPELPQIGFPLISLSPDFCVRREKMSVTGFSFILYFSSLSSV